MWVPKLDSIKKMKEQQTQNGKTEERKDMNAEKCMVTPVCHRNNRTYGAYIETS